MAAKRNAVVRLKRMRPLTASTAPSNRQRSEIDIGVTEASDRFERIERRWRTGRQSAKPEVENPSGRAYIAGGSRADRDYRMSIYVQA
jgi:hypothetical protein